MLDLKYRQITDKLMTDKINETGPGVSTEDSERDKMKGSGA